MYSSRQSSELGSFVISQLCMYVTCGWLCLTHLVTLCTECFVCTTCCNIKELRLLSHSILAFVMVIHSTLCEVGISFIYNWDKCQPNQVISSFLLNKNFRVAVQSKYLPLEQWFPTWGTRTPRGTNQDIKGHVKKNWIMAEKGTYVNSVRQLQLINLK